MTIRLAAVGSVLLVQGPTLDLNPLFDAEAIATAYAEDDAAARAEYGAEFRTDVETFVSRDVIDACVVAGRHELPRRPGLRYVAFTDPAGGSGGDSFTLAVAHAEHRDGRPVAVLDAIREATPPFSPEAVVADFGALLRSYGVSTVVGDAYAGSWPAEAFRRVGLAYRPAGKPKSAIYLDSLPALNAHRVELLDSPRLVAQLGGLERRTHRGGRDSIDHAPGGGGHDDLANAALGAVEHLLVREPGGGGGAVPVVWTANGLRFAPARRYPGPEPPPPPPGRGGWYQHDPE